MSIARSIVVWSLPIACLLGQRPPSPSAVSTSSSVILKLDGPAEVFVDGQRVASTTSGGVRKIPVSAGEHFLEVRSNGRVWEKKVAVLPGTQIAEDVQLLVCTVGPWANPEEKSDLERTIGGLQRREGDLGVKSLIATNLRELAALRALGERTYIEFKLTKANPNGQVRGLTFALVATDVQGCTFAIEAVADGNKTVKKDKKINEPIQYELSPFSQPYELVVHEIRPQSVAGYLSAPRGASVSTDSLSAGSADANPTNTSDGIDSIRDQIIRVEQGRHNNLPAATASPLGTSASSGSIRRTVENGTAYTLIVLFGGPVEQRIVLGPGRTEQVELPPGTYKVAAHVSAPSVLPFFGVQIYSAGQEYTSHFYIR